MKHKVLAATFESGTDPARRSQKYRQTGTAACCCGERFAGTPSEMAVAFATHSTAALRAARASKFVMPLPSPASRNFPAPLESPPKHRGRVLATAATTVITIEEV